MRSLYLTRTILSVSYTHLDVYKRQIHEVGDGNMYAEKASTSLRAVVDGIQAIADSAKKIKEISIEQADSMEQVEATA